MKASGLRNLTSIELPGQLKITTRLADYLATVMFELFCLPKNSAKCVCQILGRWSMRTVQTGSHTVHQPHEFQETIPISAQKHIHQHMLMPLLGHLAKRRKFRLDSRSALYVLWGSCLIDRDGIRNSPFGKFSDWTLDNALYITVWGDRPHF